MKTSKNKYKQEQTLRTYPLFYTISKIGEVNTTKGSEDIMIF